MPKKAVSAETMAVGKKGGGKHWTAAQVAARKKAAESLKRSNIDLKPPAWLTGEPLKMWKTIIKDPIAMELFDNLDNNVLAAYCCEIETYRTLVLRRDKTNDDLRLMQSSARVIAKLADQLGMTPQARARLVQKKADQEKDTFGEQFD